MTSYEEIQKILEQEYTPRTIGFKTPELEDLINSNELKQVEFLNINETISKQLEDYREKFDSNPFIAQKHVQEYEHVRPISNEWIDAKKYINLISDLKIVEFMYKERLDALYNARILLFSYSQELKKEEPEKYNKFYSEICSRTNNIETVLNYFNPKNDNFKFTEQEWKYLRKDDDSSNTGEK